MANIEKLAPLILKWEGGYVNDPDDPGGETNRGVTIATWRSFGHDISEKLPCAMAPDGTVWHGVTRSLWNMTHAQWIEILRRGYWDRWRADEIADQSLANILVDWVWASGAAGITVPQTILGVKADGIVGPLTLAALHGRPAEELFQQIKQARFNFVDSIVRRRPLSRKYLRGWRNRISSFEYLKPGDHE